MQIYEGSLTEQERIRPAMAPLLRMLLIGTLALWVTNQLAYATGGLGPLPILGGLCRMDIARSVVIDAAERPRPSLSGEFSLLGMEATPPNSPLSRFYRQTIFSLTKWAAFPQVNIGEFTPTREISGGNGNKRILIGTLNGTDALLKFSNPQTRSQSRVLTEARWLLFLNKFGLGPEFLGLFETPEGDYGIAMRTIAGISFPNLPNGVMLGRDFSPQPSHLHQILRTGFMLRRLGIEYAPDLQFILTPDGKAVLIDPEYFSFQVPRQPPLDPQTMPYEAEGNALRLAHLLRPHVKAKSSEPSSVLLGPNGLPLN